MNTPITFETSKALKEKCFKQVFHNGEMFYFPDTKELTENHRGDNYPAPTIAEVVMWLYEKHEIWIEVNKSNYFSFDYKITKGNENLMYEKLPLHKSSKSPTEAYISAITYTLNNLLTN